MNRFIAALLIATLCAAAQSATLSDEDFLTILRAKYERDMSNSTGRVAWHGAIVREEIDTNTLTKVTTYADGVSFTDKARIIRAIDRVKAANKNLPKPIVTNGIPVRLANARIKQREATTSVSNVTVSITAGK